MALYLKKTLENEAEIAVWKIEETEEELKDLARRCTFYGARTIGSFRVLGYEDILAIYRMANH